MALEMGRNAGAHFIGAHAKDFFYKSVATRNDNTKGKKQGQQNYVIAGETFTSLQAIEDAKDRLKSKYQRLDADRSLRNWQPVGARGNRNGTQASAMENWNALGAAAYAAQVNNLPLDLNQDWEWLHIQGVQNGGVNAKNNLGAGTWKANSAMIPYENRIRAWGNIRQGRIYAAYEARTQPNNSPILKQIAIYIYADANHPIGPIAKNDPIGATFDATQGVIQDGFTNKLQLKDFEVQKDERQASEKFRNACQNGMNMNFKETIGYFRTIYKTNKKQAARVLTHIPPQSFGMVMNSLTPVEAWTMAFYLAFNHHQKLAYQIIDIYSVKLLETANNKELVMLLVRSDQKHFNIYYDTLNSFMQNKFKAVLPEDKVKAYHQAKNQNNSNQSNNNNTGHTGPNLMSYFGGNNNNQSNNNHNNNNGNDSNNNNNDNNGGNNDDNDVIMKG